MNNKTVGVITCAKYIAVSALLCGGAVVLGVAALITLSLSISEARNGFETVAGILTVIGYAIMSANLVSRWDQHWNGKQPSTTTTEPPMTLGELIKADSAT